jgi:hypothetical protein
MDHTGFSFFMQVGIHSRRSRGRGFADSFVFLDQNSISMPRDAGWCVRTSQHEPYVRRQPSAGRRLLRVRPYTISWPLRSPGRMERVKLNAQQAQFSVFVTELQAESLEFGLPSSRKSVDRHEMIDHRPKNRSSVSLFARARRLVFNVKASRCFCGVHSRSYFNEHM